MQFYNTRSHQLGTLTPLKPGNISLYTCGPTVYDFVHIGNLRAFIFEDTLRRTLEAGGYTVAHVMNITDVGHLVSDADEGEDKLEKGAARAGKSVREVADAYTQAFKDDVAKLNILPPNTYKSTIYGDSYARATEFIEAQIEMIRLLIEKKHAYITDQAIYVDVTSITDYGILTGQKLEDKEVGARSNVVTDPAKHHPSDFAVWFFTVGHFATHSMRWPSPWGEGFPGWHLECSAIIHAVLGDPIDIHTGGVDHIGTHHTNELAQTQSAYGNNLANLWLHNEFVMVDGKKMSKSTGTGYTINDIEAQGYDPVVFRLLVLQAHYRSELNFTWASMDAARSTLERIYAWSDLVHQPHLLSNTEDGEVPTLMTAIQVAFEDDLSTPAALAHLSALIGANLNADQLTDVLRRLEGLFGLGLTGRSGITQDERLLITSRVKAREGKDWKRSDELRNELRAIKIEVRDTSNGPRWWRLLS